MTESVVDYSEQPLAVEVDDVTMIFNMASESLTNLKEYFIKLAKHELFFEEFRALKHISFDIHRGAYRLCNRDDYRARYSDR